MRLKVKPKTSLDKIRRQPGRSKSTERVARGRAIDMPDTHLVRLPSARQQRRDCIHLAGGGLQRNLRCPITLDPRLKPWVSSLSI
jgi:SUMO ligase MMS21 Smc5/6 complex component